ncbi:MAG: hypothetical protein ACXWED_07730, partial [Solirubrobacterales bacterium]
HKLHLHEVPVEMRQRASGRSSITRMSSAYYMFRVLLAIFIGLFRRTPLPAPGERLLPGLPAEG